MKDKSFFITSFESDKLDEDSLAAGGEKFYSDVVILRKLSALARFFDENGLSTRRLTASDGLVDRSFVLRSTDVTPEGLSVFRKAYEKWERQAKTPRRCETPGKGFALDPTRMSKGTAFTSEFQEITPITRKLPHGDNVGVPAQAQVRTDE